MQILASCHAFRVTFYSPSAGLIRVAGMISIPALSAPEPRNGIIIHREIEFWRSHPEPSVAL
jgi:hypothetical protein